ncbi:ABC transporter permease [Paenibacillus sp. N3/727]|uniref:ABC transporter permease n=1 Tax=Paenibacillus sp. N3/727 TaxID=2925845 RepID=UPI001F538441|nr:ABC transporter permease [Paenibacillus sp. N3/727]UNK18453.1 ABC transporter permease [Paenibacillus sp. N3/727]
MFLAVRELKHSKLRYLLIGFIMVLIAWLVLFVTGLAQGLASDNASSIQNMKADYLVVQKEADQRLNRSVLTEQDWNDIREHTGEQAATPLGVQMTTLTRSNSTAKVDAAFFAIDTEQMLAPTVVEGSMISQTKADEVLADRSLKEEDFKLGDQIIDQTSGKAFTIVGFTEGQSFSHAPVLHMNYKGWESIHNTDSGRGMFFNAIALSASSDQADQLVQQVPGIDVISKDQALQGIPGYKEEQGSLMMMIVFLYIIAAFVLAVFFYVITIQKMNQFGVLKAIGAQSAYLARNLILQIMFLSVVSLIISIALTYGVAALIGNSIPFDLSPSVVLGSAGLFLFVSLIGSLLSLYRVVKIDAIEAIGRAA